MTRISQPIYVIAFVAVMIFGAALLLSTMINSAESPIEPEAPAASADWPSPVKTA